MLKVTDFVALVKETSDQVGGRVRDPGKEGGLRRAEPIPSILFPFHEEIFTGYLKKIRELVRQNRKVGR